MKDLLKFTLLVVMPVLIVGGAFLNLQSILARGEQEPVVRRISVMGTFAEMKFYADAKTADNAARVVQDKFKEVEKTLSIFDPESEVSKMNATAYREPFRCSEMLWEILCKSRKFYELSGHAFDVSACPLMELWGFYRKREKLPGSAEIEEARSRTGLDKVIFDDKERTIRFTVEGMRLDFGGIAKGYAVDLAAECARNTGVRATIINLGGNLYCFGQPSPTKKYFRVGIRNPFDTEKACGIVNMTGKSVSTSGNYEKYVLIEGRRFTHIMNPATGLPVEGMIAVSVITDSACDADALSTSFFIRGRDLLDNVICEFPSVQVLFISGTDMKDKGIYKVGALWPQELEF